MKKLIAIGTPVSTVQSLIGMTMQHQLQGTMQLRQSAMEQFIELERAVGGSLETPLPEGEPS